MNYIKKIFLALCLMVSFHNISAGDQFIIEDIVLKYFNYKFFIIEEYPKKFK